MALQNSSTMTGDISHPGTAPPVPRHSPREANCLWRARRDCSLERSSFTVSSMWLALRELSAVTVCCGQERTTSLPCQPWAPSSHPTQPWGWAQAQVTAQRQGSEVAHGRAKRLEQPHCVQTCASHGCSDWGWDPGDSRVWENGTGHNCPPNPPLSPAWWGEGAETCLGLVLGEVQAAQLLHPHVRVAQFCHVVTQGQDAVGTRRKGYTSPQHLLPHHCFSREPAGGSSAHSPHDTSNTGTSCLGTAASLTPLYQTGTGWLGWEFSSHGLLGRGS